jgi:hypothetical protein
LGDGDSLESRIVRGADILDMLLHAITLERGGTKAKTLDQFFSSSHDQIERLDLEIVTSIFRILLLEHKANL